MTANPSSTSVWGYSYSSVWAKPTPGGTVDADP